MAQFIGGVREQAMTTDKLSSTQRDLLDIISRDRFELRQTERGRCFIYDFEYMCADWWLVRRTTVEALLRKGIMEPFATTRAGTTRFQIVDAESEEVQ